MKKGDIVTICDPSWVMRIRDKDGVLIPRSVDENCRYQIIEMDCLFPLQNTQPLKYQNTILLRSMGIGMIVIAGLHSIKPIVHTIKN